MPLGQAIEPIDPFVQPCVVPYCTVIFLFKNDLEIKRLIQFDWNWQTLTKRGNQHTQLERHPTEDEVLFEFINCIFARHPNFCCSLLFFSQIIKYGKLNCLSLSSLQRWISNAKK